MIATIPELNDLATRWRLGHSARQGFRCIAEVWSLTEAESAGLLSMDEAEFGIFSDLAAEYELSKKTLTRISLIIGIYKGLHILLPDSIADQWPKRPNDDSFFEGRTPLAIMLSNTDDMQMIRNWLGDHSRSVFTELRRLPVKPGSFING